MIEVSTQEQITDDCKEIQSFLDITCSDNPEEVQDRGLSLMAYLARTSKMVADCQYHYDNAIKKGIFDELKKLTSLSPSTANKLIDSYCVEEKYLLTWTERLNRCIVHQMDFCRTVLSKAKAEMQNFNLK